jgi:hypothetical protein
MSTWRYKWAETLKIVAVVQEIMRELSEAVSEKYIILVITKMVRNLIKQNGF